MIGAAVAFVFRVSVRANTMMPEGFEHGGKLAGVMTTLGFAVASAIHTLD